MSLLCNNTMLSKGMECKLLTGREALCASGTPKGYGILGNDIFFTPNLTAKNLKFSDDVGVVALHLRSQFFLKQLLLAGPLDCLLPWLPSC